MRHGLGELLSEGNGNQMVEVTGKGGEMWFGEEWGPRSSQVRLREKEQFITHIT
jgi:hypothetical protein